MIHTFIGKAKGKIQNAKCKMQKEKGKSFSKAIPSLEGQGVGLLKAKGKRLYSTT